MTTPAAHTHAEYTDAEKLLLAPYGLTTTKSPFIEQALQNDEVYIHQPYALYSEENHSSWAALYTRMQEPWTAHAHPRFLEGLLTLQLDASRVPRLEDVNKFLEPSTKFKARAVSGYVPSFVFFDCIAKREFPTTITIRDAATLNYLPEPDIFHDVAGHVPMHTDERFAQALVRFGECAYTAARRVSAISDPAERVRTLTSIFKAMSRFFWFTIEFGLVRGEGGSIKAYGSGLLSSYGELAHACTSPTVQRFPFEMGWVVNQYFEIDHFQPLLFVIDSFDHLYKLTDELEQWMLAGKLDNVSPGEPKMNEADVASFMDAVAKMADA